MRTRSLPLARLKEIAPFDRSLSASEAAARRAQYGGNDIVEVPGNPWLDLARDTAKDPMLWFFMGTGVLYALVGQRAEAITLGIAILPLLLMDAFLHRRTSASTQGLKTRLATEAVVIRNELRVSIAAVDIVPLPTESLSQARICSSKSPRSPAKRIRFPSTFGMCLHWKEPIPGSKNNTGALPVLAC
jgi:Ca2+-transporting ATPase